MKVPNLNQRGVTLVEVLAVLVLLTLVGGIAYSFLINSYTFQDRTTERISIVQESNTLSTSLRRLHENGGDAFLTGINELRADTSTGRILHDDRTRIANVLVDGQLVEPGNPLFLDSDEHTIQATLINGEYEHSLITTLERLSSFSYQSGAGGSGGDETDPPEGESGDPNPPSIPPHEEDIDEVEFPSDTEELSYTNGIFRHAGNNEACNFTGDTRTQQDTLNNQEDGLGSCDYAGVFSGNLLFTNAITMRGVPFNVDGSLFLANGLGDAGNGTSFNVTKHTISRSGANLQGYALTTARHLIVADNLNIQNQDSYITVGGSARVGNDLTIRNTILSTIQGNLEANNLIVENASPLNIGGSASLNDQALLSSSSPTNIGGNLLANSLSIKNQSQLNLGGNASLNNQVELESSNPTNIGGNLTASSLSIRNQSRLNVGGNIRINGDINFNAGGTLQATNVTSLNLTSQNQANINILGDLIIQRELRLENGGSYKVGGDLAVRNVYFNNSPTVEVRGDLTIIENRNGNTFSNGKICVFGEVNLHNNSNEVTELSANDYTTCNNTTGGEIILIR